MALDMLKQFLGGSASKQRDYGDFLHRFQQDPTSISGDEAASRYRELLRNANPSLVAEAFQHVAGQLAPEQRQQLAEQFQSAHQDSRSAFNGFRFNSTNQAADPHSLGQMAAQAEQQDPDLFDKIFGQNSPLNSTLGRLVLAGVAADLANRALSSQQPGQQGGQNPSLPTGLGGLGGLIGALSNRQQNGQNPNLPTGGLGGLLDALSNQQRQQGGQNPGLPGGLGGLLDALSNQQGGQSGQGQGIPGGLGGLLDALAGGQQGGQGQGIPGGLGGLLDALDNQQGGQQPSNPAPQPSQQGPDQGVKIPGLHVKGNQDG
jgi:hypothetical protein